MFEKEHISLFQYLDESRHLLWYRVYEIDEGVYLVHCRNKRDYYGNFILHDFYATEKNGKWITDPEQPAELVKELAEAMKRKG